MNMSALVTGVVSIGVGILIMYASLNEGYNIQLLAPTIAGIFIFCLGIFLLFNSQKEDEIEQINEYFKQLKAALGHKYSHVLTHNDFSFEHILWDSSKKKIGVIDFSDRAFADPASDFFSLCEYGQKFLERVYSLYTGKKDKYFLERSQLYFKRIPFSLMIHGLTNKNCTFEEGYEMFKKRFKIAKTNDFKMSGV